MVATTTSRLQNVFAARKEQGVPVFITFLTAAYPKPDSTVDLLLAMEAGGADIIELGVPFSDPIADGPAIQTANTIALSHRPSVDLTACFGYVREARERGLRAPVLLMGYLNPVFQYGDAEAVRDAKAAGVDGWLLVDAPPEEAVRFRELCTQNGLSYVPLVAPSTSDARVRILGGIADSFIYVVSKMGVTGASSSVSSDLSSLLKRIRRQLPNPDIPLAVGFGVSSREHFDTIGAQAEGVVIGSKLVTAIGDPKNASSAPAILKQLCEEISGGIGRTPLPVSAITADDAGPAAVPTENGHAEPIVDAVVTDPQLVPGLDAIPVAQPGEGESVMLPPRFGEFGGQYVPEALYECLAELEAAHRSAMADPAFQAEWKSHYGYMNRPSEMYEATRMTEHVGGARIWFKREDLNHTGSHKINNALGQILLARRIGKKRIIAETGAGQHGVATASVCAKFGLECVIYMGAEDVRRQALNVFRIKMLGAKVVAVASGSQTLKDAINEAMRDWVSNLSTTHYLVGSAIGPHPFPTIVRDFQSVIGTEIRGQMLERIGKLPEAVVACVGGGSNAIGTFSPLINDKNVRLIGVEAAGDGLDTERHSATISKGKVGVLHGVKTLLLQDKGGQIIETHSISAGLDYPGVGPEHAHLHTSGRAEYTSATDEQALRGFRLCCEQEGIIPALETSHAIWATAELAKTLPKTANIVMTLSGRGDKDVQEILDILPKWSERLDWKIAQ